MRLVRLVDLSRNEARKIRARQIAGQMTEHFDKDDYLCFDADELATYKPRRAGRKAKSHKKMKGE